MQRTSWWLQIATILALSATATPSHAMVILDSTWKANGGGVGHETDGFGANEALAEQRAFDGAVSVALSNGAGSGTWIGNDDDGHGYILTAAHLLVDTDAAGRKIGVEQPDFVTVATSIGGVIKQYKAKKILIHPKFRSTDWASPDIALIELSTPVALSSQPMLYCGRDEVGRTGTMVGFGMRGIGSVGEAPDFQPDLGGGKLAADNRIDAANNVGGGTLTIDFDPEGGNPQDAFGTRYSRPVDKYEGLPANGDSGAPMWIHTIVGWVIAGVVKGGPSTTYGSLAQLVRVSGFQDWIHAQFPEAMFDDGHGGNCGENPPLPRSVLGVPSS